MPKEFIAFYQKHLATFRDLTEEVALNIGVCAHVHTPRVINVKCEGITEMLWKAFKIYFAESFP